MAGIISTAEFKTWRGIGNTDFDSQIDMLAPIAQSTIEGLTSCVFDSGTYTETHDGDGTQELYVKAYGITSITSVKSDADTSSPVTLDSSSYNHDGIRCIRRIPRQTGMALGVDMSGTGRIVHPASNTYPVFDFGFGNIQVVYGAGFDTDDMPDDLKLAAFRLVDMFFETRGEDIVYIQNKGDSGATRAMRTVAESDAMMTGLVKKYRRSM